VIEVGVLAPDGTDENLMSKVPHDGEDLTLAWDVNCELLVQYGFNPRR
jgi:hypothetical protein